MRFTLGSRWSTNITDHGVGQAQQVLACGLRRVLFAAVLLAIGGVMAPARSWAASQLILTWANGDASVTAFKIERAAVATGPWTQIAQVLASPTSYVDTGLVSCTSYYYRIRAHNSVGDSAYSKVATGQTPCGVVITLAATPTAGGLTSGGGTKTAGASVTVTATPNAGYGFVKWTEGATMVSTAASYTFTASTNRTLVANFATATTYTITTSASPTAGGLTSGGGTKTAGASVTVTATPNAGYSFVNWTEGATTVSTAASYTFTASTNRTLVANFSQVTYTISTSATPTAGGSTSGGGITTAGASVTVTATPNAGYSFVNWSEGGTAVSTAASYTFTATSNRNLVAYFAPMMTPPTGLSVTLVATNQINLSWIGVAGATSYNVKRATTSGGPYTTLTAGLTATSYANAELASGATYFYVATAVNVAGESTNSVQVSATTLGSSLPSPWQTADIGSPGATGNASYSGGTFTILGAGAHILGTSDKFRYVYQLASGDCEIKARVASVHRVNTWSKAGVMIRETLTANAKHASVFVTPGKGVAFQRRTTTGGRSANTNTTGLVAPYWVRVVRRGNIFTTYRSANGSTWTTMGAVTNTMAANVFIGLAVTSHVKSNRCTATFDNVTPVP